MSKKKKKEPLYISVSIEEIDNGYLVKRYPGKEGTEYFLDLAEAVLNVEYYLDEFTP